MRAIFLASTAVVAVFSLTAAAQASPSYCELGYAEYCGDAQAEGTAATQIETQRASTQTLVNTISRRVGQFATAALGGRSGLPQLAALGTTGVSTGDAGGPPLGVWGALSRTHLDGDSAAAPFDTKSWTGMAGADVQIGNTLVGVTMSLEDTEAELDLPVAINDTDGWMATPYIAQAYLGGALVVDAMIGYGQFDTDVERARGAAPITGEYESKRYLAAANVTYQGLVGDAGLVAGKLGYAYAYESGDGYTDTANVTYGDPDSRVGTVRTEIMGSYLFDVFEPFAAVSYLYDVQRSKVAGTTGDRSGVEGRVGATLYMNDVLTGGVEYAQEFSRSDLDSRSLTINLRAAF
jgi:outer membrane autotransporter protein